MSDALTEALEDLDQLLMGSTGPLHTSQIPTTSTPNSKVWLLEVPVW
jgi:hypothetical protein